MPHYRIYYLGARGHFASAENVECADDQGAIEKARQAATSQSVELWEHDRFIVRLPHGESQIS
jgi:hypothetical protein